MILPKILFASATLTLAATVANHWPQPVDTTVRHGNHDGLRYVEIDCGPGPRVLVLGGSVANGWGASDIEHEWWVLACRRIGGTWRNAAQPAARVADELRKMEDNDGFLADRIIAVDGANDLVLGLAPRISGQIENRVRAYREGARNLRGAGAVVAFQPVDLSGQHPTIQTLGHEAELRRAYRRMAKEAGIDLSDLPVDFLDVCHFGDRGHRMVADKVSEILGR